MKQSDSIKIIQFYFPELDSDQVLRFELLRELYLGWNSKINVISRKDTENFYTRHVLHSLAIAKFIQFRNKSKIIDVGTGGGFPGIPLAIYFSDSSFTLIDSIGKKIKVVDDIAKETKLPLFVHERDAFHQMHSILKENIDECENIVVHCFTGTKNSLIDYLDLGVHIGLTGWVCDDRRGKHLRDFIDIIPDDKLLIETDSPYLSPYISSKKPEVTSGMKHLNKPAYLVEVAKDVAKYRNQSYDHICEITYQNYLNFFGEDK